MTIFLLGQMLTKMKGRFVLNNWKVISNAVYEEPRPFSQDYFLVRSASSGFHIQLWFGWMRHSHTHPIPKSQLLSTPKSQASELVLLQSLK